MSLKADSSTLYIIDYDVEPPHIVFDSTEGLFHCTESAPIVGNVTLPARTATVFDGNVNTRADVNLNNFHALAAVHPSADIVLGGFSVTTFGGTEGIAGLGVFDAGGSHVHVQEGPSALNAPWTPSRTQVTTMAVYTFLASGGTLYLNERVFITVNGNFEGTTRTRTLLSVRFDFKLYVGTIT